MSRRALRALGFDDSKLSLRLEDPARLRGHHRRRAMGIEITELLDQPTYEIGEKESGPCGVNGHRLTF